MPCDARCARQSIRCATHIRFNGQKTGWDVSIVDREFGHRNSESMVVMWERISDALLLEGEAVQTVHRLQQRALRRKELRGVRRRHADSLHGKAEMSFTETDR